MKRLLSCLALLALLLLAPSLMARENAHTGLVLAGGGARGIAHAGVIKALEEMQIPVHGIAGTSMGALVGGLYSIGMDADDLHRVIQEMDWDKAFQDSVERDDLPPRRKSDDYDYPSSIKLAFKDGDVSIPLGFVQGQQTRQLIKELMIEADQIRDFDKLPTPYRAVAADIETGNAYVFSEGDIVTAMRASMSLPGLLAPVEHDGRLLVDGGVAMNIPVSVGRDMGAEQLIVIDIGTPLKTRDEIRSVIAVADQMLGFLTRRNSLEQLETLEDQDILIQPDLTGIGMLSFDQAEVIFQRGYDAAMALRERLLPLAVDDTQWQQYLASRELPAAENPTIEFIAVNNDGPISDDLILARLQQQVGAPLDRDQLRTDIADIYALDYWEIIDYELTENEQGHGLLINARAKTWGADKLKLGLNLVTDMDGSSEVNIGGSYLLKGVTDLGGEIYGRAQVGDTVLLSAEFYQPLDLHSRFFVVPFIGYRDHDVLTVGPEFDVEQDVVGNWRVRRLRGEVAGGLNLFDSTQLRLGLFRNVGEYRADAEIGGNLEEDSFQEGGAIGALRFDRLDHAFFPTRGSFLYAEYEMHRRDLGADHNFERWQAIGQLAYSFGAEERNTVIATARTGQSIQARNEPQNYFQLGGLFNLSGAGQNLFSGRQMAFAMAQYQRRLSDNSVLPIKMPAYVGASIEGGQLWSRRSDIDWGDLTTAGSIYLAIDSPIGPLYFAYGRTEDSIDAVYLSLGWPFLSNQMRMGR